MAAAKWEQRTRRAVTEMGTRMDADPAGMDPALVAAARRLGLQRVQRAGSGVRLYDDARRRPRLAKRLRDAGFAGLVERTGDTKTTASAGDGGTQGHSDGHLDEEERRQRRRIRACGILDREGESMRDGEVQESTVAGFGGAGLQSGLPVGRGDG